MIARATESDTAEIVHIDRSQIVESGLRTTADLVRLVPGVLVLDSGTRSGVSHARSRGGDPNFTLVLLDGVPVNDSTDTQGGAVNLNALPVSQIESVEVMNGPHSHFFGSSAVAGAIALKTRSGGESPSGEVLFEGGDNSLRRSSLSVGGPTGVGAFFVGGDLQGESRAVADESFEQANLQANLGFDLSGQSRLRLTGRSTDWQTGDYPESSGGPVYGSGVLRLSDVDQTGFSLDLSVFSGSWEHAGSVGWSRTESAVDSPAIVLLVPPSQEVRQYRRAQVNWLSRTRLAETVGLSFGAQLDDEDASNESLLLLPPEFGGAVMGDYVLGRTTPGAFVEASLRSGGLSLDLGVRADDPESLAVQWSPRAGLRYAFGSTPWQLRAGWSHAFKLPSFFAFASPPALGGNPDLLPETSQGGDLGVEWRRARATIGLGAFAVRYSNLIDFDFDAFQNVNRSKVDAQGIELLAMLRPHDRVDLRVAWTLQDVTEVGSSEPLLNEPDSFGTFWLGWAVSRSLRVDLEGRFVSASADRQLAVPDRDRVEGYETLGVGVAYEFPGSWRVSLRVDNLTDEEYEQFIGFPAAGRSARVGVRYGFGGSSPIRPSRP